MAKLKPTSFDYLVMALNPALVFALVGSLVFFLIEVFYEGEFQTRLCFIMGCFTLGTVGITRIAIELDASRASLYGMALSGAMLFVAPRFAEINILLLIVLLAVIWYSAHRLTWDCTLIDEDQDASGEGLLQRIGLDEAPTEANRGDASPKQPLWKRLFAPDKSKHAPGLTVVYFSLAALPIFGFLQGFIPTGDVEARGRAFLCLIAYVGAGLGLLLTTSLLGLRRYLRQRNAEMPTDMTATWLVVGGGLIAIVLAFATVLPRSAREFQLGKSPITFTSAEQIARKGGWGKEGAKGDEQGKGQNEKEENPNGEPGNERKNGQQEGGNQGEKGEGESKEGDSKEGKPRQGQGKGQGQEQGNANDPNQKSGDQNQNDQNQGEPSKDNSRNDPNQNQEGEQKSDQKGRKQEGESKQKQPDDQPKNRERLGNEKKENGQPDRDTPQQNAQQKEGQQNQGNGAAQQRPSSTPSNFKINFDPTATVPFLGWLLKVIIFAAIAIVLIYCAIRYRKEFLAAMRQFLVELANFWRSLFGGKRVAATAMEAAPAEHHRRFSEMANPFRKGVGGRNPRELVQETFGAMEAWARDHGYPREKEQTAFEFADALSQRVTDLAKESKWLADCYSKAAYSPEEVSTQVQSSLATIWQRMEQLYGRIPPPAPAS